MDIPLGAVDVGGWDTAGTNGVPPLVGADACVGVGHAWAPPCGESGDWVAAARRAESRGRLFPPAAGRAPAGRFHGALPR